MTDVDVSEASVKIANEIFESACELSECELMLVGGKLQDRDIFMSVLDGLEKLYLVNFFKNFLKQNKVAQSDCKAKQVNRHVVLSLILLFFVTLMMIFFFGFTVMINHMSWPIRLWALIIKCQERMYKKS